MPFGTDDLQYGQGYSDDEFGAGGSTGWGAGSSIFNEYIKDATYSADVNIGDYVYGYDPLKEQNLLADYMSGLVDMGDKTEGVRKKAVSERKALSRSIRGGLTSGTMVDMEKEGMETASKAQASLYRDQASSKRALGEGIGSLREAYESDLANSIESYNDEVNDPDGETYGERSGTVYDWKRLMVDTGQWDAIEASRPEGIGDYDWLSHNYLLWRDGESSYFDERGESDSGLSEGFDDDPGTTFN